MEIREWTTNDICCKGGSGGGQNTPSAAKGGQGVDKKFHLLHWSIRGGDKNAICCKEKGGWTKYAKRKGGGQKMPSAPNGDQGVDKNAICCK